MFPYRIKYTESEYDIQNNDLLYKIHQQCQNTFDILDNFEQIQTNPFFVIYIISIISHNSMFVIVFCLYKL